MESDRGEFVTYAQHGTTVVTKTIQPKVIEALVCYFILPLHCISERVSVHFTTKLLFIIVTKTTGTTTTQEI